MQAGWWLSERFSVIGMKLIQALSQLMNPIHLVCSNQCILPILFAKRTLNAHTSDSSVTPRYRWIPCSFLAHDKSVAPSPSCTESQRQGHTCDRAQRQSVRDTRCQTDTGKDTKWNTQIWFTCGQPALTQMAAPELLLSLLLSWWELRPRQSAPATQRELGKGKAIVTLLLVRHTTHYWCPKAFMVASVSPPSGPETPQLFLYWIDITWYLHLEDSTDTNSGRSCISSKLLHKFLGFLDTTFSFELATFFFFFKINPIFDCKGRNLWSSSRQQMFDDGRGTLKTKLHWGRFRVKNGEHRFLIHISRQEENDGYCLKLHRSKICL